MKFLASIRNRKNLNEILVGINDETKEVHIPSRSSGYGSAVSGGELLLLSLATCFCNDIYREAGKRNISISEVNVDVTADFDSEGEAGSNFQYKVEIRSDEPPDVIESLITHTDEIAEIHQTLRKSAEITLLR